MVWNAHNTNPHHDWTRQEAHDLLQLIDATLS